ncbi:magnesium transporter MRS2-3-like, partial [Olea europaea subsp. europaea]
MRTPPLPLPKHTAPLAVADEEATGEPLLRPTTINAVPNSVDGGGLWKKSARMKPWLLLESTGQAQVVEAEKHTIMRRTRLPAHDLQILNPLPSYPSVDWGRDGPRSAPVEFKRSL